MTNTGIRLRHVALVLALGATLLATQVSAQAEVSRSHPTRASRWEQRVF